MMTTVLNKRVLMISHCSNLSISEKIKSTKIFKSETYFYVFKMIQIDLRKAITFPISFLSFLKTNKIPGRCEKNSVDTSKCGKRHKNRNNPPKSSIESVGKYLEQNTIASTDILKFMFSII